MMHDDFHDDVRQLAQEESLVLVERATLQEKLLAAEAEVRSLQLELSREREAGAEHADTARACAQSNQELRRELETLREVQEAESEAYTAADVPGLRMERANLRQELADLDTRLSGETFELNTELQQKERKLMATNAKLVRLREELEAAETEVTDQFDCVALFIGDRRVRKTLHRRAGRVEPRHRDAIARCAFVDGGNAEAVEHLGDGVRAGPAATGHKWHDRRP